MWRIYHVSAIFYTPGYCSSIAGQWNRGIRDDFHIAVCTTETLTLEYVVYLGWVATGALFDQVCVSLHEPGVANEETIGYGEVKDSLTLHATDTEAVSTMGIAVHTGRSANVIVSVTNLDKYLSGWNLGNSALQLVIETFLFRTSSAYLRSVHW